MIDLIKNIDNLFSGNRELERYIETDLQNSPTDLEEYLKSLNSYLKTALKHQETARCLIVMICQELRALEWRFHLIITDQNHPMIGIDDELELTTIRDVRDILISRYEDVVELLARMEKRIEQLRQTLDKQSKRMSESVKD